MNFVKDITLLTLACKVQKVLDGCENCMKSKSVKETQLRPPLQKIYDPCDGPEDLLEIDIVGPLPTSNGFTHILTAVDVFSRYLFAVPLKRPDTHSVVRGLLSIFHKTRVCAQTHSDGQGHSVHG